MDRRHFLGTSTLALAATALGGGRAFGWQSAFQHLRRGVGIFNGQGGTIGWLANDAGILVIDSQNAASAAACIEGLGAGSPRSIDFLVNTHHHGDHVGGNQTFQPVVGSIVAHENSASWQRRVAEQAGNSASQAYPDVTFSDEWRETIGDETIVAKYYGAGHTSGDVTVRFERANVVHMGDLMFNRLHPFVDRNSGARIRGWIETLGQVPDEHGSDTVYIFGHGSTGVTGGRDALTNLADYFTAALEVAQRGIQAGRSRDEIAATEQLSGFGDYVSPAAMLSLSGVLGVAYDELSAG